MTEIGLTYIFFIKIIWISLIGFLYSRAGRGDSFIRRAILLPCMLSINWLISILIYANNYLTWPIVLAILITPLIYFGTMKGFSYGANSWLRQLVGRVWQQFIVGFVQGLSPILLILFTQKWGIYSLCVLFPMLTLGTLGGWADTDTNASWKEGLTGIALFLFPVFII
jgi:hypothetical protein